MTGSVKSVSHEQATEAKTLGQQGSIFDLLVGDESAFMDAVRSVKPGLNFTANTIREALDDARVPDKQRAALMRKACQQGLCEPVMDVIEGTPQHRKVRSTGASAKGAYVGLYRRLWTGDSR